MDKYWGYNIKDDWYNMHNWGIERGVSTYWNNFDEEYMDLILPPAGREPECPWARVDINSYIRIPKKTIFYQFSGGSGTYNSPYIVSSNNKNSWDRRTEAHIYYMVHGPGYVWIRAAVQSYYGYGGVWTLDWSSYYNTWHWSTSVSYTHLTLPTKA